MNVVVGQNNSGKTAMLQAVGQQIDTALPHRDSSFRREQANNPVSRVELRFIATTQETRDAMFTTGAQVAIPKPNEWGNDPIAAGKRFFALAEIEYFTRFRCEQNSKSWEVPEYPSHNLFPDPPHHDHAILVTPNPEKTDFSYGLAGRSDSLGSFMSSELARRVYYFTALRTPQSEWRFGQGTRLAPNAENLAEVLNAFQANRTEYTKYIALVRRVLPAIKWVSVVPATSDLVQIKVWNVAEETGREDLAVPLKECGTGVGQVLAILYVVSRSVGNIIIIDEPNSFLHPRAAKTLVGILREYPSQQFILSTHSTEILIATRPEKLFMLRFENERTLLTEVDQTDLESARQVLAEIGSNLSDVFGVDHVLWVEGPTETECFPLLLSAANRTLDSRSTIASLRNTGDLEGRHAEAIADIYRNLSSAGALLPMPLAIALDGDMCDHPSIGILRRACGDVVHFLPRWTYENYLVHPKALASILNDLPSFREASISDAQVMEWLELNGQNNKFGVPDAKVFSMKWLARVKAADLLADLFQEISDGREIFRKPYHSVALTRWLLTNDPMSIQELIEFVSGLIPRE
jgi:predicted ATPase